MRRKCELCNAPARLYCASDQAFICLHCDSRVHSANFLVAKHLRNLLCRVCQSSTPWNASGARLGQIVSVCIRCVVDGFDPTRTTGKQNYEEEVTQVVPSSDQDESPPFESSSSSLDSSNRFRKRMRGNRSNVDRISDQSDDDDDDDECCSSSLRGSTRAMKVQRLESYELVIIKKETAQDQQDEL